MIEVMNTVFALLALGISVAAYVNSKKVQDLEHKRLQRELADVRLVGIKEKNDGTVYQLRNDSGKELRHANAQTPLTGSHEISALNILFSWKEGQVGDVWVRNNQAGSQPDTLLVTYSYAGSGPEARRKRELPITLHPSSLPSSPDSADEGAS